jgi:hypothetical protein
MKNWTEIDGWFNEGDADVYRAFVDALSDGAHILEIGAYKGRSTLCLAQLIRASGKNIKIHVVDTFKGDAHIGEANTFKEFTDNLCPYKDLIGSVSIGMSDEMAEDWSVTLDAVYVDASHDYKSVCTDIDSWLPHVRIGGYMGGHDYDFYNVRKAVDERFDTVAQFGNSWLVFL